MNNRKIELLIEKKIKKNFPKVTKPVSIRRPLKVDAALIVPVCLFTFWKLSIYLGFIISEKIPFKADATAANITNETSIFLCFSSWTVLATQKNIITWSIFLRECFCQTIWRRSPIWEKRISLRLKVSRLIKKNKNFPSI